MFRIVLSSKADDTLKAQLEKLEAENQFYKQQHEELLRLKDKVNAQEQFHSVYLQTFHSVTLGMMRRLDLSNLLNVILNKACGLSKMPGGFLFLFDQEKNELILKAAVGTYKNHIGLQIQIGEGIVGKVFETKEPMIVQDYNIWHDRSTSPIFSDISGIIGVPLISGSMLQGVIGMSNDYGEIDIGLIRMLEKFSSIATIVIDHSRLSENLKNEFNRRIEIEKQSKDIARKQNQELKSAYLDSIHRLVMASEFKDEDTGDHIVRIGEYSRILATKLGWSQKRIDNIYYAAPMHDVGKIGIPDKIMLKPGKLTDTEFDIIKTHTTIGEKLLSKSNSNILKMAKEIALNHHEKYNGRGYPNGRCAEEIPISARIVAIADTFDALTSKRPYKEPYPPEMALNIIKKESGEHFDPRLVDLFIENFEDMLKIRETVGTLKEIDLANFVVSERDQERFNLI